MGKRGSYEAIVEVNDPEASKNMSVIMENAQWFEDNSPLLPEHKKKNVVGITYRFINTVGEAGDAAPSTPIGVNLPNADWIRADTRQQEREPGQHHRCLRQEQRGKQPGGLLPRCRGDRTRQGARRTGRQAAHRPARSGGPCQRSSWNPGVAGTDVTLKNYASTLEEGRADLVALYYIMDPKLIELGVMPSLEVGKAEYDSYIRNGLLVQLRRLKPGKDVEEAHMRNRMWVSAWVYEKGQADSVIVKVERNGDTYYDIRDYEKLRVLFGDLLREVQRIKSQGDYEAGQGLGGELRREGGPCRACASAGARREDQDRAVLRIHPAGNDRP